MNKKRLQFLKGFTIIETIVAIAIIMTAIAGPMTASHRGLNAATGAKDQFVAQYLAQDAIEYFYYFRDKNIMSGGGWLDDLPTCNSAEGCTVDTYVTSKNIKHIPPGLVESRSQLYQNAAGFYTHVDAGNTETSFRRQLFVHRFSGDREVLVTVVVKWGDSRGQSRELVVEKNIYNR